MRCDCAAVAAFDEERERERERERRTHDDNDARRVQSGVTRRAEPSVRGAIIRADVYMYSVCVCACARVCAMREGMQELIEECDACASCACGHNGECTHKRLCLVCTCGFRRELPARAIQSTSRARVRASANGGRAACDRIARDARDATGRLAPGRCRAHCDCTQCSRQLQCCCC